MKNLFLLFVLVALFSCANEEVKVATEATEEISANTNKIDRNSSVYDIMFNDLMLLDAGGMFRGLEFDMEREKVRMIEKVRSTTSELSSEKETELIITTDLGSEILDFADIKYTFDKNGLYFISAESYLKTEEKATKFYEMLKNHFTEKYGEGVIAADEFLDFKTKNDKYAYQISIKEISYPATDDQDGSYGFYLVYSMQTE